MTNKIERTPEEIVEALVNSHRQDIENLATSFYHDRSKLEEKFLHELEWFGVKELYYESVHPRLRDFILVVDKK